MGKEKSFQRNSDRKRRRSRGSERGRVRKGLGACIFTLGIPLVIAGTILLIVANSKEQNEYVPPSFPVLGPVLIVLSLVCFTAGSIMTEMISITPCLNYCIPDDPKNFCWKRCPRLYSILRPNDVSLLNRRDAGLNALQSAPSRPVLKKATNVNTPTIKRGVRFSDSDAEVGRVTISVSSEPSENDKGNNSPNTSLLSLRHCKIYPKEGERLGSMTSDPGVMEEEEEEGAGDGGAVFTLSGSVSNEQDVFVKSPGLEHVTEIEQSDGGHASPDTKDHQTDQGKDTYCEHF